MNVSTIKKVSRKSLSVFLAVLMLMTSMSVCFGTFALAAGGNVSTEKWDALVTALKNDTVKNAKWNTETTNAYTVTDPDGSILAAVEAYWAVFKEEANTAPAMGSPSGTNTAWTTGIGEGNRTINQVNASIISTMKTKLGSAYTPDIDGFLKKLISGANVPAEPANNTKKSPDGAQSDNKTNPGTPLQAVPAVNLTVNISLASYTLDSLPSSVAVSKTFTVKHSNAGFDTKYSTGSTGGCNPKTTYTREYRYFYYINEMTEAEGAKQSTQVIKDNNTVLVNNSKYLNASFEQMVDYVTDNSNAVDAAKKAVDDAKTAIVGFSQAAWDHFFASAYDSKIKAMDSNITFAKETVATKEITDNLTDLKIKDYGHISLTDDVALLAYYNKLKEGLDIFDAASDKAKNYIIGKGFDRQAIADYAADVYHDYELATIRKLHAEIDSTIPEYKSWTEDDVIGNPPAVKKEALAAAKGKVDTYITQINKFNPDYVAEAGMDKNKYINDLTALSAELERLMTVSGYNDQFSKEYTKFLNEINAKMDPNADSATLVSNLQNGYDKWYTDLKNLIASIEDFDAEIADKIMKDYDDTMKARMDAAYAVLNARVSVQLDALYANLSVNGEFSKLSMLTLETYAKYKPVFEGFDYNTYKLLVDTPNYDMSQETIDKYNAIAYEYSLYNDFHSTFGFKAFVQYLGEYIDREALETDIFANGEYNVDKGKVEELITKLDNTVTSPDVVALLSGLLAGEDAGDTVVPGLGAMLEDMVVDMLFNDAFINSVIQMLYPAILEMLLGVWEGNLDSTIRGMLKKDIVAVINDMGFALYPHQLGASLEKIDSTKYADNISKLKEASQEYKTTTAEDGSLKFEYTPWTIEGAKFITEEDDKKILNLTWGVDAAREAGATTQEIKAAFYEGFNDAFLSVAPLFYALLGDKAWSGKSEKVLNSLGATADLNINASANAGYANALVPIFEALGAVVEGTAGTTFTYKKPSTVSSYLDNNKSESVGLLLSAILEPVFGLLKEVGKAPLATVISILPNLCYALSMNMFTPILDQIKTHLHVSITLGGLGSLLKGCLEDRGLDADNIYNEDISVGSLLDINSLLELEEGETLNVNTLISSLLKVSLPEIDQKKIALMGELVKNPTSRKVYTYPGLEGTGKAYHINADKGAVGNYLLNYIFGVLDDEEAFKGILGLLMTKDVPVLDENGDPTYDEKGNAITEKVPDEEKIAETIATFNSLNLFKYGVGPAVAAVVELFVPDNKDENAHFAEEDWYVSSINPELGTTLSPFTTVYLQYSNDWTSGKAQELVDNLPELLAPVLEMAGLEGDMDDLLKNALSKSFTTETVTKLILGIAGIGAAPELADLGGLLDGVLGADFDAMYKAFGYLIPAEEAEGEESETPDEPETVAEGEEAEEPAPAPLKPDEDGYENNTGIEAVVVDGVVTGWKLDGVEFTDGDRDMFLKLVIRALGAFVPTIHKLISGGTISALNAIDINCAGVYTSSLAILLKDVLGIANAPTEADLAAKTPEEALLTLVDVIFDWIEGKTIVELIELVPNLLYFIESNGLSVVIRNLLHPILVLLDTIRPIADIGINSTLSHIISELINGKKFALDIIALIGGNFPAPEDPENYKSVHIDIKNLRLTTILEIVDAALGTNLLGSPLRNPGLDVLFAGTKAYTYANGDAGYKTTISVYDALTVLISALIETLNTPLEEGSDKTNADAIFALIEDPAVGEIVATLLSVITGFEYTYTEPKWGYMVDGLGAEPVPSINYLDYKTDWTEDKAEAVYAALDEILVMVLPEILKESGAENLAAFVNDMLTASVFTEDNLNMIVEGIANLLVNIDASLFDLLDLMLDTDISSWFSEDMIKRNEETGKYECIKDWGIAEAADKKTAFVDAILELLEGAEPLLAFLLFGDSYEFFTGSKHENNEYVHNSIITINGGAGYDRGIVPIFTALGFEMEDAAYYLGEDGKYDVTAAIKAILDNIFGLINKLETAESTVKVVMDLLPNLIYFINADGLKSSVNNILAPIDTLLGKVAPMIPDLEGKTSLGDIIGEIAIGETEAKLNITDLSTDALIKIAVASGVTMTPELADLVTKLYVGKFESYTYAEDENDALTGYRLDVEGYEYHVLTIVLSLVLDIVKQNAELFTDLLGEDIYAVINALLTPYTVTYRDIDWGYMYTAGSVEADNAALEAAGKFKAVPTFQYLKYATDWTPEKADAIYAQLNSVIAYALGEFAGESSIAALLQGVMEDKLYTDANLKTVVELIVNALAGFDKSLADTIGVVLDADISTWFGMCDETTDADGNTVYVLKDNYFGVDTATDKEKAFVDAIKEILQPANRLLSWLFFEDTFTFFKSATGETLITLQGGKGYDKAIVPIFEALGCELKSADAYYNDKTKTYNVDVAVADLLDSALKLVDKVSKNPAKEVMALIPNLLYFINADGLVASVNNLLAPVEALFGVVSPLLGDIVNEAETLAELLNGLVGVEISNLNTENVLALLESETVGLVMNDDMKAVIKNIFALGVADDYTSVNGEKAYRVDVTGKESDVLTVLLSFAIDAFKLNKTLFAGLLPEGVYDAVVALIAGINIDAAPINWAYMYSGNMDELERNGFPGATIKYLDYSTDWTAEVADSVYAVLADILDLVLPLVLKDKDLYNLVNDLIAGNLYKTENLETIVELIVNLLAGFDESLRNVVDAVLDVNIADWFSMCEVNADGKYEVIPGKLSGNNRKDFIAGLKTVLEPAEALLNWLFFGESYTFFNGTTSEVLITVNGGKGYAYGILPILEALGVEGLQKEYRDADGKLSTTLAVEDILNKVLDLVDVKLKNSKSTVEFAFTLIPNLLYFINSDGLKVSVNNLVAPVDAIIGCLSDVVDAESLAALLTDVIGIDISNLETRTLLTLLEEKTGFVMNAEMRGAIYNIYEVGKAKDFTSENGKPAYKLVPDKGDALTVILSFALDAFNLNKTLFAGLMGEEMYDVVYNLIRGASEQFVYAEPNWAYMYEGGMADLVEYNGKMPKYPENSTAANYLLYKNNWNKNTAKYVNDVVDSVVAGIMGETSLGQMLDEAIANGLYKDDILNSLLSMVVGLVVDYAEIIEGAGALLGAESISKWFSYCVVAEDGTVIVTKDFGIDEAATIDEKRELFVEAFVDVLEPAYRLLAWLLFDQDFTFFNGATNEVLITLTGGRGYEEGFVPLLEAVGAKMPGLEDKKYENGETAIWAASHYELRDEATGEFLGYNMEAVVRDIFSAVTDWLYMLCGNMANQGEYGVIGAMLDLLPNVVYNINAGTLKAVVQNLLLPVEEILGHLKAFGLTVNFSSLIEIGGAPLDIKNLDWYAVFNILESALGLYWPKNIQDFLATYYLGEAVEFTSANGKTAYYMTYNADDEGDFLVYGREDMITTLISFVIDGVLDSRNAPRLSGWLGEDVYNVIYKYLANEIVKVDMQDIDWALLDPVNYADTGIVISPITLGAKINSEFYGELYTREMGEYIEKWLPSFVDSMIVLLGVQSSETGENYEGLSDILNELIGTTLYTKANLDKILELIQGLIPTLEEALPAGLFEVLTDVLNQVLGVDLTYWNEYAVADVTTGDRAEFVDELTRMLAPVYPVLRWLLTGDDLIALFNVADGRDAIVIEGAQGYAEGIIPLLEAFDHEGDILTPAEFEALEDAPSMLKAILNPALDVVDTILADPVNEIFNVLPGVIYFLNSNGLDTVIKNTANAVFTVLENIKPLIGEFDIYELIGFNGADINIETLIAELIKGLEEDTGFQLTNVAMDALTELTVGKLISFTSANGKTAYTVEYATGADRVDMVTVVLRTVLTFVSIPENVVALEGMLEGSLDGEGYKFLCSLLENFSQMAAKTDKDGNKTGMDEIMYTVYQIFYAANVAAHSTENWFAEFNGDYSFLNQLFKTSELDFLRQIEASLGDLLNKYTGDIIDDDELAPNGLIAFFQKIADFFKKIGEFFKNLFK